MSTDFITLFDIGSEEVTAEWLREKLAANPDFATWLVDRYRDYWLPKEWIIETPFSPGEPWVTGPGGFGFIFRPHTLQLYHMMQFSTFTGDLSSRDALRRACLIVAKLVGSVQAIYTHELMPTDGESLAEIEKGLRAKIGPPASTFSEFDNAEYFGPHAWYIETFADLSN